MQKLFNKILVPVDFSPESVIAIEKAAETALQYNCSIHLLHVATGSSFAPVTISYGRMMVPTSTIKNKKKLDVMIQRMRYYVHLLAARSIAASYSILKGMWDDAIIELVDQYQFDLVLIGQKAKSIGSGGVRINPDKIASKTNIAVITVPANKSATSFFSIIIPITDFLPVRKIMYAIYMACEKDALLMLLGVENEKTKNTVHYYVGKACKLIVDNCNIKVASEIFLSQNVAEAVNQYAMLKSADLIILNPGIQTKMPGFFSSFFGNIIQKYSAPPVLTVNPV